MTSTNGVDPGDVRAAIVAALRAWARQRDRQPAERAALLAAAWHAGERNLRNLERAAAVSRQTVYDDLRGQGISPATDRSEAPRPVAPAPLDRDQVADLEERMTAVLLPSMVGESPGPLTEAAWQATLAIAAIAKLLDEPAGDHDRRSQVEWLQTLAARGSAIAREARRMLADESSDVALAALIQQDQTDSMEFGHTLVESLRATVTPDGLSRITVELDVDEGRIRLSSAEADLAPVDPLGQLQLAAALEILQQRITAVLPAHLAGSDI